MNLLRCVCGPEKVNCKQATYFLPGFLGFVLFFLACIASTKKKRQTGVTQIHTSPFLSTSMCCFPNILRLFYDFRVRVPAVFRVVKITRSYGLH